MEFNKARQFDNNIKEYADASESLHGRHSYGKVRAHGAGILAAPAFTQAAALLLTAGTLAAVLTTGSLRTQPANPAVPPIAQPALTGQVKAVDVTAATVSVTVTDGDLIADPISYAVTAQGQTSAVITGTLERPVVTLQLTGLTADTAYALHFTDLKALLDETIAFHTAQAPAVTPPSFAAAASDIGRTAAKVTVTVTDPAADTFPLNYRLTASGAAQATASGTVTAASSVITLTGLTAGTTYKFELIDAAAATVASCSFTTLKPATPAKTYKAPTITDLTVMPTDDMIIIASGAVSVNDATITGVTFAASPSRGVAMTSNYSTSGNTLNAGGSFDPHRGGTYTITMTVKYRLAGKTATLKRSATASLPMIPPDLTATTVGYDAAVTDSTRGPSFTFADDDMDPASITAISITDDGTALPGTPTVTSSGGTTTIMLTAAPYNVVQTFTNVAISFTYRYYGTTNDRTFTSAPADLAAPGFYITGITGSQVAATLNAGTPASCTASVLYTYGGNTYMHEVAAADITINAGQAAFTLPAEAAIPAGSNVSVDITLYTVMADGGEQRSPYTANVTLG